MKHFNHLLKNTCKNLKRAHMSSELRIFDKYLCNLIRNLSASFAKISFPPGKYWFAGQNRHSFFSSFTHVIKHLSYLYNIHLQYKLIYCAVCKEHNFNNICLSNILFQYKCLFCSAKNSQPAGKSPRIAFFTE